MAVVLRRSRHLSQFGNIAASCFVPARKESGLPPVKTERISSTLELRSATDADGKQRPLAVIFGWMRAKRRHLNKYGNLYLSKGFDVLTIQVPPHHVLWPSGSQERIENLLGVLQDSSLESRPLLVHGFSVGGYLYGEMLVKLREQDKFANISERMVGQVFDSPVDFEGVPRGFANVLAKNHMSRTVLRKTIEMYLKLFEKSVTSHYHRSSSAFHDNHLRIPSLFLYSRADPIGVADIIEIVMEKWRCNGIKVSHKCWDHSPHVSHFHHHPDEYVEALLVFLDSLGFSTPERQEVEREKDVQQQLIEAQRARRK